MFLTKSKERKIGIALQYVQMGLNIVLQFLYIPIMLRILGANEYGIYNLSSSIIAYLSLLSLGFGASYLRFYSKYKKDDNEYEIKKLNGLYLMVFSIIGVISLAIGLFLAFNVQWFYNDSYSAHDIKIARVLMLFLAFNMAVSFPASVFVSYVTSQERFVFQKLLNMGKTIVGPVANIVVLYLGFGSIGMVVCSTVVSILIDTINVCFCLKKLKMGFVFSKPNILLLKDIFVFSIFIAINQIIDQINWQTDKIILGKMVSGTAVAVYSVGASINTMFISLTTAISSVFSPKINMIVSKNKENMDSELTELFVKVGRIQWFLVSLVVSGFVFFGRFFILKWAGDGYEKSYYVALLLILPMIVPACQTIGIEIQRAKNKHKVRSLVYLAMSIVNVGISVLFAYNWGEIGCALGTTISIIVGPCLFMNFYYHFNLGINIKLFWKSIFSTVPAISIPVLFGICITKYYQIASLSGFIIFVLIYIVVFTLSLYFFGINDDEKKFINNIFNRSKSNTAN